jgi:ABC-type glycerol-3-phosphate transport system permease component
MPKRAIRQADWGDLLGSRLRWLVIVVLVVFAIAPILDMVLVSLTPEAAAAGGTIGPAVAGLAHYVDIWSQVELLHGMINSVVIAGGAACIAVLIGFGGSYALSRTEFRGRLLVLYGLLTAQSIPGAIILFPLYVLLASLQVWLNVAVVGSYPAVILTYTSFALPFSMWILASYMGTIPRDLEEAAMVDGASRAQTLWAVIVPLARPGAVVAFIFSFLLGWNDVLFASALTDNTTRTVAVALQVFNLGQESAGAVPEYAHLMAAAVVSALPVMVLYLVFQRHLTGGLTLGALK